MPRFPLRRDPAPPPLEQLFAVGEDAPTLDQKVELASVIRGADADRSRQIDRALLERLARLRSGLETAEAAQRELRELLERLASPPWHPALFLRAVDTEVGRRAMVLHGGGRRVVALGDGVDLDALAIGEEVLLATEGNVVAARSPWGVPRAGETAYFERVTGDDRLVLRWRDEEVVVDAAASLDVATLAAGDQVRWDRTAWMAFERLDPAAARRWLLDDVPAVGRELVGGQDRNLDAILSALTATLVSPEVAALYGIGGRRSILLVGPPGCGKTLMARVAAAEVSRLGGRRCRFGVVKPAEWESPWVGETQQNIRRCFQALRQTSDGYAVLFLDEIESVGRIRGGSGNMHGDKFLAALLAELDGFTDRSDIAIVAATNRKDLVDPALLERLSDVEVTVGRPDLRAAQAILGVHLPAALPFADAEDGRAEAIETAVSTLYGPNADNTLCTLRFRDGKTRVVAARELASGRLLEQVCRAARATAFERHVRGGARGIRPSDVALAMRQTIERLTSTLTPRNAHAHLADLPQDVDVVSVDPVKRRSAGPYRYSDAA